MSAGVRLNLDGTVEVYGTPGPPEPGPPPTPLEWMDRLPRERQAVLLEALNSTPQGRLFAVRLTAAKEIDPAHPDTIAGVQMLLAARVLTDTEAAALLA